MISADGTSLVFLGVEVVDRAGVLVPDASHLTQLGLAGPTVLDGVDNGQRENALSYRLSSVPAFNGRALSNYYDKPKIADLLAVSVSNPSDWVPVSWPSPRSFDSVQASFTTSSTLAQPAVMTVSYWDGSRYVPVRNLTVSRAAASNQPTTLRFDAVRGRRVRLDMTSAAPGSGAGFLQTVELQVLSGGTAIN